MTGCQFVVVRFVAVHEATAVHQDTTIVHGSMAEHVATIVRLGLAVYKTATLL